MTLSRFWILQEGCQLIISVIPNLCQKFKNNKPVVDRNFAFIDQVSTVYYGGQAGYAYANMHA